MTIHGRTAGWRRYIAEERGLPGRSRRRYGGRPFGDIQPEQRPQTPVLGAEALHLEAQLIRRGGIALTHGGRPLLRPWVA